MLAEKYHIALPYHIHLFSTPTGIMVTFPFSQVLPLITAKLARNVPTIPFSYACTLFFLHKCAVGNSTQAPYIHATFVRRVGEPIGLLIGAANPVGL